MGTNLVLGEKANFLAFVHFIQKTLTADLIPQMKTRQGTQQEKAWAFTLLVL